MTKRKQIELDEEVVKPLGLRLPREDWSKFIRAFYRLTSEHAHNKWFDISFHRFGIELIKIGLDKIEENDD